MNGPAARAWFAAEDCANQVLAAPALPASPDTSVADYVWLPVRFNGDMVYLDWKDEWRVEDYE